MGAEVFMQEGQGSNAKYAFEKAVEHALYEYGHRGYTGTLAEKDSFVEIPYDPETDGTPEQFANKLIDAGDDRIDDKWGPAGCIDLGGVQATTWDGSQIHTYLFFGWASS